MRRKGVEPSRLKKAHAPEACVSAIPPPPQMICLLYFNLLKMQGGPWEMEDQFFCSRKAF